MSEKIEMTSESMVEEMVNELEQSSKKADTALQEFEADAIEKGIKPYSEDYYLYLNDKVTKLLSDEVNCRAVNSGGIFGAEIIRRHIINALREAGVLTDDEDILVLKNSMPQNGFHRVGAEAGTEVQNGLQKLESKLGRNGLKDLGKMVTLIEMDLFSYISIPYKIHSGEELLKICRKSATENEMSVLLGEKVFEELRKDVRKEYPAEDNDSVLKDFSEKMSKNRSARMMLTPDGVVELTNAADLQIFRNINSNKETLTKGPLALDNTVGHMIRVGSAFGVSVEKYLEK